MQQLGGGLPVFYLHTVGGAGGPRGKPGSFSHGTSAQPVGRLAVLPRLRLGGGRRTPRRLLAGRAAVRDAVSRCEYRLQHPDHLGEESEEVDGDIGAS